MSEINLLNINKDLITDGRGIVCIKYDGKTNSNKSEFLCPKGHNWYARVNKVVRKRKDGCPICRGLWQTIETINKKLLNDGRGYVCIKYDGKIGSLKSLFRCSKDHQWVSSVNAVVGTEKRGCNKCSGVGKMSKNEIIERLVMDGRGYTLVKMGYSMLDNKTQLHCSKCNLMFNATLDSILNGKHGHIECCGFGLKLLKPAKVYAYRIDNFIGFGVTGVLSKENRFKKHQKNLKKAGRTIDEVIGEWYFNSGKEALKRESQLKKLPQTLGIGVEGFIKEAMPYNTENLILLFKILA